jgi:hypothetical protein
MGKLTFNTCLGFILTLLGFHWGAQAVYDLIGTPFFTARTVVAFLLVGGGAGCAIFFGMQMLKNGLQASAGGGGIGPLAPTCQCGRPLVPGAQFCTGCGRKVS